MRNVHTTLNGPAFWNIREIKVKFRPGCEVAKELRVEDEAEGSGEGSREGPALDVHRLPDVNQLPVVGHDAVRRPPIP